MKSGIRLVASHIKGCRLIRCAGVVNYAWPKHSVKPEVILDDGQILGVVRGKEGNIPAVDAGRSRRQVESEGKWIAEKRILVDVSGVTPGVWIRPGSRSPGDIAIANHLGCGTEDVIVSRNHVIVVPEN